jgi:hypothetical protein
MEDISKLSIVEIKAAIFDENVKVQEAQQKIKVLMSILQKKLSVPKDSEAK